MDQETFNFYGVLVEVASGSLELLTRIRHDFSYFLSSSQTFTVFQNLKILALPSNPPSAVLPSLEAIRQNPTSIVYEKDGIRFNDYHGEALSIFDYRKSFGTLYSSNLERLHELTFLLTLSRVEKALDLRGFHKIHAFGVRLGGVDVIGQMPSKGGKTTLFMNLLRSYDFEILSDDTPLVTRSGRVLPFPIRIGLEKKDGSLSVEKSFIYEMERKQYGRKILIDVRGLRNSIAKGKGKRQILLYGVRASDDRCLLRRCSKVQMVPQVVQSMVVGIGLPMVLEYFLETGFKDFFRKVKIILSRSMAMVFLIARSKTYQVVLGRNLDLNAKRIDEFLRKTVDSVILGVPQKYDGSQKLSDASERGRV